MTDQTQRLEVATVKAEIGSDILHRFANDGADAEKIPTNSGAIRNLKQVVVDIENKASISSGVYASVTAGLVATVEGGMFLVASSDSGEIYEVWRKQGGLAVDTGKRALSSERIAGAAFEAEQSARQAEDAADLASAAVSVIELSTGIFPTIAKGLTATPADGYFSVPGDAAGDYLILYHNVSGAAVEVKRYPSKERVEEVRKDITPRKRPLGPVIGETPMIFSFGGVLVSPTVQKKRPLGPDCRQDPYIMMGDTIMSSSGVRKRPLTSGYPDDFLILSGDSVAYRPGTSVTPVTPTSYDAKLIQEQSQAPAGTRQAAIVGGQVWAYAPAGTTKLTAVGTWLAAQAVAFDIVRALKSATDNTANHQPHSITQDGRIFRDGQVLLHKLVTGQSLALGSRGIVLDVNGEYTIDGKKGNLFSPYTPIGYTDRLWTLAGGPRPSGWAGTTAFSPVREFVSGVVGETPATSYMLATRRWHERNTSISPHLLYSISAQGGTAYAGLKKGTQVYADLLSQVTTAKAIATTMGLDHVVPSISIVHGESQTNTTRAEYVTYQIEWGNNLRVDVSAITGQAVAPIIMISQMLTGEAGVVAAGIPLAQMDVCEMLDWFVMVGPKYDKPYFDTYHMTAEGYIKMGELEARAERLTQVSGKWQPLKAMSATVSGNTITLRLNNLPGGNAATPGPIGKLAIDKELVTDPGNAGFQISAGTITSVALGADGASLVITTAAAVAAGTILTYALQPTLGSPQTGNGRRGCIRDTDLRDFSRYEDYKNPLYNWLCAFSMELQ